MDAVLAVVALLNALMQGALGDTWAVSMPIRILGIEGSCVAVPCRFQVPAQEEANVQNCSNGGIWKTGDILGPAILSARNPPINTYQGEIVGDLTQKNCSTVFSGFPKDFSTMLVFRLDCLNNIKYSFTTGVNVSVRPAPTPSLQGGVRQASEGDQVRLQCSVPVPCPSLPPSIDWLPRDASRLEHTHLQQSSDGLTTMTSTLTFTASAGHHNQSFVCSASYPLTKGGSSLPSTAARRLHVLYAPRSTVATVSTSGRVSEGQVVILTCSSDANPPAGLFTWYQAGSDNLTKRGEGEDLVLVVRQGDSGAYLCEAQNQRGSQRSRPVILEVNAAPAIEGSVGVIPYVICGVVLVLYILTLAVDVYKYRSISRRLKEIELKGEHTYTDLRISSVTSDYDQIQPKTPPSHDASNYENLQQLPSKPISNGHSQRGASRVGATVP